MTPAGSVNAASSISSEWCLPGQQIGHLVHALGLLPPKSGSACGRSFLQMRTWLSWLGAVLLLEAVACARRPSDSDASDASTDIADAGPKDAGVKDATVPRDRSIGDVTFTYNGPSDDGSIPPDAACAAAAVPAQPVALDMYIVLDRSATMRQPLEFVPTCRVGDATKSRWCYAINALGGFFSAPTSNGMGVALEFFPHGACGWVTYPTEQNCCTLGDCCAGSDEAVPEVALGELPGHLPALVAALNAQDPLGTTTPLEAALRGMTRYAASAKRPDRQMVGLITTDGSSNGCERDAANLAAILRQHRDATGQLTFVVGMTGANYTVLETLAQAGGAPPHETHCAGSISPCSFYDVGDGNPEAFVDALQQIQRSVVGCRFGMPTTDSGLVDPNTMMVEWNSSSQTVDQLLPHVTSMSDCGKGWYADPTKPGEFSLCPETCNQLQAEPLVHVNVLAGCLGS